jgi:hypothetical protein
LLSAPLTPDETNGEGEPEQGKRRHDDRGVRSAERLIVLSGRPATASVGLRPS